MTEYHKINAPFYRDMQKPGNPLIPGKWALPELGYLADNQWEFTEKVDGTNIRIVLKTGAPHRESEAAYLSASYYGRTDKANIPPPLLLWLEEHFPTLPHWRRSLDRPPYTERNKEVMRWMQDKGLDSVVLYGEGYGPKIQSGGKYRDDVAFVLFDVKVGDFWLDRANVNDVASKLGIEHVPVVGYGTLWDGINMVRNGLESLWGDFEAEGIVARPTVPLFSRKGERILTKIKARDFRY